jgi:hypothetical protein
LKQLDEKGLAPAFRGVVASGGLEITCDKIVPSFATQLFPVGAAMSSG